MDPTRVAAVLHRLYIGNEAAGLRDEDRKKVAEVAALLDEIARVKRRGLVVDAAAGKATVGLLAAELVGLDRLVVIERDPRAAARSREAAARVPAANVEVREGDVADAALWPDDPDLVVALHACGAASDVIVDRAAAARARVLLLVPCCYSDTVAFAREARRTAEALGAGDHGEVRRRVVTALVDLERTLRLESLGYETTVMSFVAP